VAYLEYVHVQPRSENLLLALGKALDFTAADLMENRKGKLHPTQFARLAAGHVAYPLATVLLTLLVPVVLRIGWLLMVEERSFSRFLMGVLSDPTTVLRQATGGVEESMPMLFWVIVLIFPLMTIRAAMKIPWAVFIDLGSRKVLCESGQATNHWDEKRLKGAKGAEGDLVSRYDYVLNDKRFQVSRAAFEALAPSLEYNLYYLPLSKIVVSIEPKEAAGRDFDPAAKGFQARKKTELLSDTPV
jgi:hypothetical protein